jgi:hypothetical protein
MAKLSTTFGELNFLPFPAEAPMKEVLEWKTDVLESYSGKEQRVRVREIPRQTFTHKIPSSTRTQRLFNAVFDGLASRWAVPVWAEAQMAGPLSAGSVSLPADTTQADFRAGGLALVWETPDAWQLLTVSSLTATRITASSGLSRSYAKAWILPVRVCRLVNRAQKTFTGASSSLSLTFNVEDNVALSAPTPDQFLGFDIYYDEGLMPGDSIDSTVDRRVEVLDEETGVVAFRSPWPHSMTTRPHHVILENRAAAWGFRRWLHRRAGRLNAFWQPSFESDLVVQSSGTILSSLLVRSDEYLTHGLARKHIAIQTSSGAWYPRTITEAFAGDGGNVELNLDSPLNIPAESILRVSYLGLKRLDTDRVELSWVGGGVCSTSISLKEIAP